MTVMNPTHPLYPTLSHLLSEMGDLGRRYPDSYYTFVDAGLTYVLDHMKEEDELTETLVELQDSWNDLTPDPDESDITSERLTAGFTVEDLRDAMKEAIGYEG